jgi:hypothetical protein
MTKPLIVTIPHNLGQDGAVTRLRDGLGRVASLIVVDEQTWNGNQLTLRVRALGQSAAAKIDVFDKSARVEVMLPWLLAKIAEKLAPTIEREGTFLLEKK